MIHTVTLWDLLFGWGFTLVWYAFLLGFGWLLWRDRAREVPGVAVGVLVVFSAAGLFPLYRSVRSTWSRARFRRSVFELDNVPFAIGGCVSGLLLAPPGAAGAESFDFTLDCSEVWPSVSANDPPSYKRIWREEVSIPAAGLERRDGGIRVPVALMTSPEARPTCNEVGKVIEWRLLVAACLPGIDYAADFELPVFKVDGAPAVSTRRLSPLRSQRQGEGWARPARSQIRLQTLSDGIAIQYQNPSWLLPWIVGPLMLVPAGWLIGPWVDPGNTTAPVVGLVLGLAAAGFFLAIALFGVLTTPNRVEVRGDTVVVRRGAFGWGWDRRIPRREVAAVKHVPLQNGPRVDHTVDIETRDGQSHNAALGIRDLAEAKWLTAEIERAVRPGR